MQYSYSKLMIVELDSTSFPLCSAYTLRGPVSLPVQLEFGRIQELKGLAEICPIIGYHLTFERSLLVESLLAFLILFSFLGPTIHRSNLFRPYNCFATQIKHQDISYIYASVSVPVNQSL